MAKYLNNSNIEIIRKRSLRTNPPDIRVAILDFDGTLSLVRSGWMDIMVPMMVEILLGLKTGEAEPDLEKIVRKFVARLTGKQTIYQMMELVKQVRKRGGRPLDPLEYKHMYLDRLWEKIKDRVQGINEGRIDPEKMVVPGSFQLLDALKARGIKIFVASGTDEQYAAREASILGITPYVEEKIYGAIDDYKNFSKRMVIRRIISENKLCEGEILGFGDGYVEIEDVKAVKGTAVGVATDEPDCLVVDQWKRERLVKAGADIIIPNYLEYKKLLEFIFNE